MSLELGGKAPAIVYPDSDDDATVAHVIAAMRFARQGQSCTAGSRLYVHRSIFDEFIGEARRPRSMQLVVGDALDERSDIGSIISGTQDERVCGYVGEALEQGATALAGGLPDDGRPGYQLRPTVLTGVEHSWRVAREEVFGPVLVALPWDDEDEVIALGQRHPLRARGVRVLARPRRRAARRAPDRGRLGPGQPQRRPAAGHELRRQEAQRARLGVLDRGRAGELHAAQGHHDRDRRLSLRGDISIPWASEAAQERVLQIQAASVPGTPADLERAQRAVLTHVRRMDRDGLVLYAGSNAMTGRLASAHDPEVGVRPSLGDPGEKLQPGLEDLEILEVLTTRAVAATMRARHADARVPSATIANLAVYAGLTEVGATIAALPKWAGGHFNHHPEGAAGIRGHRVVELPYDVDAHDVDLDVLPAFLESERPALVALGGSLMLFPHRLDRIVPSS